VELNVVGCIAKGSDGTFMLTNAHIQRRDSATAAPAPSGTRADRPTEPSGSGTRDSMTWTLQGGSTDLERHVGHQVQVTGRTESEPKSAPATTGATAPLSSSTAGESGGRRRTLDVQALKMLDASCSEGGDHSR
jgi:hypothetical protein